MENIIRDILRTLSITGNYRGYLYALTACMLITRDEAKLQRITADIYAAVADIHQCKVHSIERNIRTVILIAWDKQRKRLCEIAGYTLYSPPTVSEFLSFISSYAIITSNKTKTA